MFVSMNASAEYRESDAPITYGFRCNVQEVSPGVFFSSVGDLASRLKAWLPRVPAELAAESVSRMPRKLVLQCRQ